MMTQQPGDPNVGSLLAYLSPGVVVSLAELAAKIPPAVGGITWRAHAICQGVCLSMLRLQLVPPHDALMACR